MKGLAMTGGPRIAIDAMGGDSGPAAMIAGASRALTQGSVARSSPSTATKRRSASELERHTNLRSGVTVVHSPEAIAASEKPSQAIRRARTTSMGMAINAVKEGLADAALSGGNTGALMAMSKLALRTMPGIDRPALAALLPTLGETRLRHARPRRQHRVRRSEPRPVRGDGRGLCAHACSASPKPRVKLLNIGTEELKGTDELKEAAALLREADYLRVPVRRLHRRRPAVARRRRRGRHRRLLRQYRAEDRRGHGALRHRPAAPRLQELASLEGRLRAVAAGAQPAQGPSRSQQP